MKEDEIIFCRSGGCTAKLGARALSHVLEELPKGPADPALLVGYDSRDDAAVYQISDDTAIVHTLDFFPPMVSDPYLFGQIAAVNALSDVYAMGGQAKTALNIVCFPESMDLNILGRILQGGSDKVLEAGACLAGGHSINDTDIKYGLSVTGTVHPSRIWPNNGARPGDVLILCKKLGTGILCAAQRAGSASESEMSEVYRSMTRLNKDAAQAAGEYLIHACTDVTGFGLLGHLHEMMGGRCSCRISYAAVPRFQRAEAFAGEFLITGGAVKNRNYAEGFVTFEDTVTPAQQEVLYDPQTAGGLLFSVAEKDAESLLTELYAARYPARIIGSVCGRKQNPNEEILVTCL